MNDPTHVSSLTTHDSIQRIDHVQITIPVGSERIAHAFYCGVLGMAEIERELFQAYIRVYGSKKGAAKALEIPLRTFHAKAKRCGL